MKAAFICSTCQSQLKLTRCFLVDFNEPRILGQYWKKTYHVPWFLKSNLSSMLWDLLISNILVFFGTCKPRVFLETGHLPTCQLSRCFGLFISDDFSYFFLMALENIHFLQLHGEVEWMGNVEECP